MRVELLAKKFGFIDLFWPGVLLVEQKSSKLDLDKAGSQALTYIDALPDSSQPRYLLTCDFHNWRLRDLERNTNLVFTLDKLPEHIEAFAFMLGRRQDFGSQPAVNIAAAELMGKLHTSLAKSGYTGHDLERLLVRLLFCMFADDTGIFEPRDIFLQYIYADTAEDGRDLGERLNKIFDVLDTAPEARSSLMRDELRAFPHVNGALFAGALRAADFDKSMREDLLAACRFDWSKVSPAIFGSLFQSVMDVADRRKQGAHYTSEANILKVIGPLFLDDLRIEFARIKARGTGRKAGLQEFVRKLRRLNFVDPACGCGNFLVIAYRDLRALELLALRELYLDQKVLTGFDGAMMSQVDVDQFHGIELGEFPARIAEVSMWMADHLANNAFDAVFGTTLPRIPLKQSANIRHGDALEVDWNDVLPAARCSYRDGQPAVRRREVPDRCAARAGAAHRRAGRQRRHARLCRGVVPEGGGVSQRILPVLHGEGDHALAWWRGGAGGTAPPPRRRGPPPREERGGTRLGAIGQPPRPHRLRRHQLGDAGRAGGAAVAAAVQGGVGDRLRAPQLRLGQRGARQGARPCRHRRTWRTATPNPPRSGCSAMTAAKARRSRRSTVR